MPSTSSRRIVFFSWPEWGHVLPSLRLATDLRSRGHHVTVLAPAKFRARILEAELEHSEYSTPLLEQGSRQLATAASPDDFRLGDSMFTEGLVEWTQGGGLESRLKQLRPALVLCDVLVPECVAICWRLGIPCMEMADSLPADALVPGPNFDARLEESLRREERFLRDYLEANPAVTRIDEFLASISYPRDPVDASQPTSMTTTAGRCLMLGPPALCLSEEVRARYQWCQSLPKPEHATYNHRESSKILLSLGNYAARYPLGAKSLQAIMDGLEAMETHEVVVLALPPNFEKTLRIPANARSIGFADQRSLLGRGVYLMCSHGGFGSVKECAYFGVPCFATPLWFDQYRNAETLIHLGVGGCTDPEASNEDIIAGLHSLLQRPGLWEAAHELGVEVRRFEEEESGADYVESVLARNEG